jgi:hypothetical protein
MNIDIMACMLRCLHTFATFPMLYILKNITTIMAENIEVGSIGAFHM